MSAIGHVSGQSAITRAYKRGVGGSVVATAGGGAHSRWGSATLNEVRLTRGEILAMNGVGGAEAATHNALATAHDALGVIGGLLANVGAVLGAAQSKDPSFDIAADQSRVDRAVATIDTVATSTTFGGKKLLNGNYVARTAAGVMTLPAFTSTHLGKTAQDAEEGLRSLTSGGRNDLASGRIDVAGKVVAAAIGQVQSTQAAIHGIAQETNPVELPTIHQQTQAAGLLNSAAREMLTDPGMAVAAVANSDPADVWGLVKQ